MIVINTDYSSDTIAMIANWDGKYDSAPGKIQPPYYSNSDLGFVLNSKLNHRRRATIKFYHREIIQ